MSTQDKDYYINSMMDIVRKANNDFMQRLMDKMMNNPPTVTNDPEGEYKRGPAVPDRTVKQMRESYEFLFSLHEELNSEAWLIGALDMRKKYERLIEEGKLVVVR